MIARTRGEHGLSSARGWHLSSRAAGTDPARAWRWLRSLRRRRALLAGVCVAATGGAAVLVSSGGSGVPLPGTPMAWLDQYEAAAVDNPARVCTVLFSSQLARSYARLARGNCSRWFGRVTSSTVRVRRVLREGPTASVELYQPIERTRWAVVLTHRATGWQAVDLLDLR
jgi:hypothetical protein